MDYSAIVPVPLGRTPYGKSTVVQGLLKDRTRILIAGNPMDRTRISFKGQPKDRTRIPLKDILCTGPEYP